MAVWILPGSDTCAKLSGYVVGRFTFGSINQTQYGEDLLRDVWQYPSARVTNTVDVHLSSLRRKLDAGAERPTIINIRRAGFMCARIRA